MLRADGPAAAARFGITLNQVTWLGNIVALIYLKFKEGRTKVFGFESTAGVRRRLLRERKEKERKREKGGGR